jgi:hypothetical protein
MEILDAIGSLAGIAAVALFLIFRKGAQRYVDEKAKNLATLEDTERITEEVERVKATYLQRSHAWKQIFEKEYSLLRDVWNSTWEFQATARSLRPISDLLPEDVEEQKTVFRKRYESHGGAVNAFRDLVIKNRPFIPPHVYESCLSLRTTVIQLQVNFEMSFDGEIKPDWEKIVKCGRDLDDQLEKLNTAIRNHIYGKIDGAESAN